MIRETWINKDDEVPVARQCVLVGVSRATLYARQKTREVDESDLLLSGLIDKEYTKHPFYGSRRMAVVLRKAGHRVGERDVENSRNDFVCFNNVDVSVERPEGLAQFLKQKKAKRAAVIAVVATILFVFALVYSRPDLSPLLFYSKIYQSISKYFPDKYKNEHSGRSAAMPKRLNSQVKLIQRRRNMHFQKNRLLQQN